MSYASVDALQKALTKEVFHYAKDRKKAAGRALGTLIEIVNFYLLKAWGYEAHIAIERRIPEYANPELTHNVEFTLHPTESIASIQLSEDQLPFSVAKISKAIDASKWRKDGLKSTQLLSSAKLLRNSCTLYEDDGYLTVAYLGDKSGNRWNISVERLRTHPFAMFECKRVGVEEGVKKGPQTIEKAKQGAYVARAVSSLQKIRMSDGEVYGALHEDDGELRLEPYEQLLKTIVHSASPSLLRGFILTVGVVSNHGNWFTSEDHNKELKVLAQSYDWLLFLTDVGVAKFVEDLLLNPSEEYKQVREAFTGSYTGYKGGNKFTKVQMSLAADKAIQKYFRDNIGEIEGWFNVISPTQNNVHELKLELDSLANKDWSKILK